MNDPLSDKTIELHFNESELSNIHQSDEYDYTPTDLTICFYHRLFDKAKALFQQDPELFSLNYNAYISSESFEGKLRVDLIRFYNPVHENWIYAIFRNEWTGTYYELDITQKVINFLANKSMQ